MTAPNRPDLVQGLTAEEYQKLRLSKNSTRLYMGLHVYPLPTARPSPSSGETYNEAPYVEPNVQTVLSKKPSNRNRNRLVWGIGLGILILLLVAIGIILAVWLTRPPCDVVQDRSMTDTNECASNSCQNSGICMDTVNSYVCQCRPGFTGTQCQQNINECASNPCQNSAICTDAVNSYICQCQPGFTGTQCQQRDAGNPPLSSPGSTLMISEMTRDQTSRLLTASTSLQDNRVDNKGDYSPRMSRMDAPAQEFSYIFDNSGCWSAAILNNQQWIQMEFPTPRIVKGIVTLGRNSHVFSQMVTSYYLSYSSDGTTFTNYTISGTRRIFTGNYNNYVSQTNVVEVPFTARYIRLHPQTWSSHISLRWDIIGCEVGKCTSGAQPVPPSTPCQDNGWTVVYERRIPDKNDLPAYSPVNDNNACYEFCKADPRCKSAEYIGLYSCQLSTANRSTNVLEIASSVNYIELCPLREQPSEEAHASYLCTKHDSYFLAEYFCHQGYSFPSGQRRTKRKLCDGDWTALEEACEKTSVIDPSTSGMMAVRVRLVLNEPIKNELLNTSSNEAIRLFGELTAEIRTLLQSRINGFRELRSISFEERDYAGVLNHYINARFDCIISIANYDVWVMQQIVKECVEQAIGDGFLGGHQVYPFRTFISNPRVY